MVLSENTKLITVGELRRMLEQYPDNMGVGVRCIVYTEYVTSDTDAGEDVGVEAVSGVSVATDVRTNAIVLY